MNAVRNAHPRRRPGALAFTVAASLAVALSAQYAAANWWSWLPSGPTHIKSLSASNDYVSGGDVLVQVQLPQNIVADQVSIYANGVDVSSAFGQSSDGTLVGLVTGLPVGKSSITVQARDFREIGSSLEVTNYPNTGPIISGPHDVAFFCQTQQFALPNGATLGPALDANCSIAPRVDYVYRTTDGRWQPLPSTSSLPADAASTTTVTGITTPFVVRIDTRTVNRGIYQSAILFNPASDATPSPLAPPSAWNKRLIAIHGFGCPGGWYIQGAAQGSLPTPVAAEFLDPIRLGQGYAIFTNTLQHPSNSCNGLLGAETAMMSKETFIESYGPPLWTLSHGCSGGSYTSTRYTDIVPGLFDGILISCTFPDPLSISLNALDAHLVTHYMVTNPGALTDAQIAAVTGFKSVRAMTDLANQAGRTDPVPNRQDIPGYNSAPFNAAVPASLRYHPVTNPGGLRGTVFDAERNIAGVDPVTGFALRPFDNVGVQYGLQALNAGAISKQQFLDLNERIGGYDQDANYVSARTAGDPGAILRFYRSGIQLSGAGGLASIPIIDVSGIYNDDTAYHYQVFHFAARERLREANGNADNYIMWRGNPVPYEHAFQTLVRWIEGYKFDSAALSQRDKMLRHKPANAVDACFDAAGNFIAETQTLSAVPDSQCNALFPSWQLTRIVAGGPLSLSIMKCQLEPIDPRDYSVTFTAAELARLQSIFPSGVCDWSKPGVNQVSIVPLASVGPAPQNLITGP